ncbi:hypothetical protein DL764_000840 [Monosporascus ibericus]|uniref:Uncharacterized protein n=1 Tax=Monosporascus ibericus TaxID=155417 RepID=A0A4Q4TWX1_9PEZI|nr:hypothetical protein DL764_000840 [Monosporascus ibericus]
MSVPVFPLTVPPLTALLGFIAAITFLRPVLLPLLKVALFLLVWSAAFRLINSRSPVEFVLMVLFILDGCSLVCGLVCGSGGGMGAVRMVSSFGFLALYALTRFT